MESAVAGAVDLGRYGRRIVKMLWDPEPTNDTAVNLPVWCLGSSYTLETDIRSGSPVEEASGHGLSRPPRGIPDTPPESNSSSFSSSLAYEELGEGGGWPVAFLDDFEARFWMTYRSGFQRIARSADPRAAAAMSLAMRLKTLSDQAGFSSDSGWGCMIRSGQSLLANALAACDLGRGMCMRLTDYFAVG